MALKVLKSPIESYRDSNSKEFSMTEIFTGDKTPLSLSDSVGSFSGIFLNVKTSKSIDIGKHKKIKNRKKNISKFAPNELMGTSKIGFPRKKLPPIENRSHFGKEKTIYKSGHRTIFK